MVRSHHTAVRRRGNILIVTLLLLALFATIGLTIVYYTKDLSERQRINIEATSNSGTFTDDGSTAFNEFLNNLIYDTPVPAVGTTPTSALWGHSLMRTMYGGVATPGVAGPSYPTAATVPWNGVGTFHEAVALQGGALDSGQIVNYEQVWLHNSGNNLRYPEISSAGQYIPKNAPYTYPDLKDFYLASFVPATGEVLSPSFYRMYHFMGANQAANTAGVPMTGLEPPGSPNPNPNWTNAIGRYLTLRPRPQDNLIPGTTTSAFPYPPMNADGTYTGDVQNLNGSYVYNPNYGYVAHNDSIWIDIGIAPMTLPNGKTLKPLVAPLIVDLDSLLNYNAVGNQWGSSGAGIGPWEINLSRALPSDGPSLVAGRGPAWSQATQSSARQYNTRTNGQQLPAYSPVPWATGAGAVSSSLTLPGVGANSAFASVPSYPTPNAFPSSSPGYDSSNSSVAHQLMFNPGEWPVSIIPTTSPTQPQPYPVSDLQFLLAQYGAPPPLYAVPTTGTTGQSLSMNTLPSSSIPFIRGAQGGPLPQDGTPYTYGFPPQPIVQGSTNGNRADPANNSRALVTPYSWSLDRPGLSPNFYDLSLGRGGGGGRTPPLAPLELMGTNANLGTDITKYGVLANTAASFPQRFNAGFLSDFAGANQTSNARAGLGPVDLNRPLADYRAITSSPLSQQNMAPANVTYGSTPAQQAVIDRQQLAMSIFVRLVVAAGADASYYGDPRNPAPANQAIPGIGDMIYFPNGAPVDSNNPNNPQRAAFQALRELAQIAANMVDYIDSDDVSTAFVWNPLNPNDPLNLGNFATNIIGEHVVFGVEKPRLVLNEVYSEVVNDPQDPTFNPPNKTGAAVNPNIRFWFELLNPTNTLTGTGPLGTGSVTVNYVGMYNPYQVQIVRSTQFAGAAANGKVLSGVSGLLRDPTVRANPANVTGGLGQVGVQADLTFNFQVTNNLPQAVFTVNPSNGAVNTPQSMLLCVPYTKQPPSASIFQPGGPDFIFPNNAEGTNGGTMSYQGQNVLVATQPAQAANQQAATCLTYNSVTLANALPGTGAQGLAPQLQNHVVMLQRLANPYLPPSVTNPYITVDYMDYVPAADRILRASQTTTNRTDYSPTAKNGYNPNPASLGKVQPYASWADYQTPAPGPNTYGGPSGTYAFTFQPGKPYSLVLPQQPTPAATQSPKTIDGKTVQHTFGQYNSMNPANPPMQSYSPTNPTMNRNSGSLSDTLMTPFDWLTHLDRTLINSTELLMVSMGKPHELTQRFITPNTPNGVGATDVTKFGNTLGAAMLAGGNTLYRALDVLRIQPYGQMTALGGRVPGKVNLNTVQDKRVWDSVFDSQGWNTFTSSDVTNLWYPSTPPKSPTPTLLTTRTASLTPKYLLSYSAAATPNQLMDAYGQPYQTPVPGPTVYDTTTVKSTAGAIKGTDRPFLPFGAPMYNGGGMAFSAGSGLYSDTLLRNGVLGPTQLPFLFSNESNSGAGSPGPPTIQPSQPYSYSTSLGWFMPHPYVQSEALRKITNSTTTVSHTFAVWVTVGYFDYNRTTNGTKPVLGAEYYNIVPGDLRRKYFAVVDRSMIGLDPSTVIAANANNPPQHSPNLPIFTTVDGVNATPARSTTIPITTSATGSDTIYSNGFQTSLTSQTPTGMNWIVIGTGPTQEIVQVQLAKPATYTPPGSNAPLTGVTQYSLWLNNKPYQLLYAHFPGESISNIVPGNPGPQVNTTATIGVNNARAQRQVQVGNFNYSQTPYSYIIPFTVKLQ